jgi:hypothetical protein
MHRRSFLKTSALVGGLVTAPGLLTACGGGGSAAGGIPEGEPTLSVLVASFELLTGAERPLAFGLRTVTNEPIEATTVQAYVRKLNSSDVVTGPLEATYTEDTGAGGLYVTRLRFDEPGQYEFVAVADGKFGTQAVNVASPDNAQAPVPGAEATATETPTTDKDLGFAKICTQEPPCGMHDISLDQALSDGRPVMLLFATPAYCQTVVCGPAVSNVEKARQGSDWGDELAWIHVEIYSDEGTTLAEPVNEWKLPTEPWLFSIGSDGKIADRLDGPMLPDWVAEMAEAVKPA